ncbi:MAG TPA: nucleotide-binding protein [Gammaproteobacteria bacterium]|jgi:predicted nucleic-acid-binding protein|nr:nucleotide-binding protein [Gammaproteobacteria bacterium]
MIGLDTNILARYYIDDDDQIPATVKQKTAAKSLIESGIDLMVCKTVLLEFEWVLRGYYQFKRQSIHSVFRHLLSLETVVVEDRELVERAILGLEKGLDFADALHHASYYECDSMASFDNKKFASKVNRLALLPHVSIPK